MRKNSMPSPSRFLSTPSARRATLTDVLSMTVSMIFLSTPSARRATSAKRNINGSTINFYPRPPRGGRLKPTQLMSLQNQISIHALREEGDRLAAWQTCFQQDFYPRPPRGGRQAAAFVLALDKLFLSTPSARRATTSFHFCVTLVLISIHALREEGDPVGVAAVRQQIISIHALREEGDAAGTDGAQDQKHFYPRPPRGGRPASPAFRRRMCRFLSTPSARRATVGYIGCFTGT